MKDIIKFILLITILLLSADLIGGWNQSHGGYIVKVFANDTLTHVKVKDSNTLSHYQQLSDLNILSLKDSVLVSGKDNPCVIVEVLKDQTKQKFEIKLLALFFCAIILGLCFMQPNLTFKRYE